MPVGSDQSQKFLSLAEGAATSRRRDRGAIGHPTDCPGASSSLRISTNHRGAAPPLQVNHKRVVRIMRKDNLLALQPKLCLVKIGRAFEINNIQRDVVTCDIDEIQLSRSFGEGQRWGSSKTMRVPASVAISSNETAIPALDSARHAVPVAAQSVFVKVASALERFQLVDSMQYLLYPSCNEGRVD